LPMDFDLQRCSRHCAATERELSPGELYYSALVEHGEAVERLDYSQQGWNGPPEGTVAWWKSHIPERASKKKRWAPNEVMLRFFEELDSKKDEPQSRDDMRYVLGLLLVRRRVLRQEESESDEQGNEVLVLYCPRRDATYRLPTAMPDAARINEIQEELARLLE